MQADPANPFAKPRVTIAVGDAWQRGQAALDLTPFYHIAECGDLSRTLAECRVRRPRAIAVGEQLPLSGGYDLVRMLRLDPHLASIPVIMLVAKADRATRDRVRQCGADALLVYPCPSGPLIAMVSSLVSRSVEREWNNLQPSQRQALVDTLDVFNGISAGIADGKPVLYQSVSSACSQLVQAAAGDGVQGLLRGVRDHDNYTYAHSLRVATYLALLGSNLNLSPSEQVVLACGGLLHDIGKIMVPHAVLNKPGALDANERAVMRGHVVASVQYLERCTDVPKGVMTIAAQHHEKIDGSGYPLGIGGSELNRLARIASIVDVFTALTDRRCYRAPLEPEAALVLMADEMATELDMNLLRIFRESLLAWRPSSPGLARPA